MKVSLITLGVIAVLLLSAGTVQSGSTAVLKNLNVTSQVGDIKEIKVNQLDPKASEKAAATLEFFRRFMPTGIWTIPPLDPYTAKKLPSVQFTSESLNGTVELSNLVVVGATNVSIKDVQVHITSKRVDWEVTIPELHAQVHVDFVNMDDGCFVFNLTYDVSVKLKNYTAIGSLSVLRHHDLPVDAYVVGGLKSTILADEVVYESTITDHCQKIAHHDHIQVIFDSVTKNFAKELDFALFGYTMEQVNRLVLPDESPIKV